MVLVQSYVDSSKVIMKNLFVIILLTCSILSANEADEIMKKVDNNLRGKNIYIKLTMNISSKYHKRTMKIESYSQGEEKSFVKILYPPKDKGITFLSLDNNMWQYVPKIERVIKIPPSMMLQNWMGSNITNDDMVRQSSITEILICKYLPTFSIQTFISAVHSLIVLTSF